MKFYKCIVVRKEYLINYIYFKNGKFKYIIKRYVFNNFKLIINEIIVGKCSKID